MSLRKPLAALAAALATLAIAAPVAYTADAAPMGVRLPPSVTCPAWYGIYSIAGLGCLSWFQVWLLDHGIVFPFRADHVTR